MNTTVTQIEQELQQTKLELLTYLAQTQHRHKDTLNYIEQELADVNRALLKLELGMYGTCEQSGKHIPLSMLSVLPTARTINEAKMVHYFCT